MKKVNIVNRVYATAMNLKETYENVSLDTTIFGDKCIIKTEELEKAPKIDGTYILHRPDIVIMNGCAIAVATMVELNNVTYNVVCTDNLYDCLDENTQKFVINHEIGHHKHNHLKTIIEMGLDDKKKYIQNRLHGDGINMEYQADAYAVSVMGKEAAKTGIKSLYKTFGIAMSIRNHSEFKKRMDKISKM